MTTRRPPRLAVALLDWWLPDPEPLLGDLVEAFQWHPSRAWFWRQALGAIVAHTWTGQIEIRPLKLVENPTYVLGRRPPPSSGARRINLTASPVHGIGGVGLLAFAVLVTIVRPGAWWGLLLGMAAGVLFGVVRVLIARRREDAGPGGDGHVLFVEAAPATRSAGPTPDRSGPRATRDLSWIPPRSAPARR